jgi:hypothetical protein
MTQQHPITPPQWQMDAWQARIETMGADVPAILLEVAQWGADQELEACCEYLVRCAQWEPEDVEELRTARRSKPPSLKEQALLVLDDANLDAAHHNILLRALEQLDD